MPLTRPVLDIVAGHANRSGLVYDSTVKDRLFAEEMNAVRGTILEGIYSVVPYDVWVGNVETITNARRGLLDSVLLDQIPTPAVADGLIWHDDGLGALAEDIYGHVGGVTYSLTTPTFADQAEVDAGTVTDEIVSPATLAGTTLTFDPKAHALDGADHTVSGLTTGDVLTATSATTFAFQTPTLAAHAPTHHHDGTDTLDIEELGSTDVGGGDFKVIGAASGVIGRYDSARVNVFGFTTNEGNQGPLVRSIDAELTVPSLIPKWQTLTSGIGGVANGQVSIVHLGEAVARSANNGPANTAHLYFATRNTVTPNYLDGHVVIFQDVLPGRIGLRGKDGATETETLLSGTNTGDDVSVPVNGNVGFYGATPVTQPTVTGSRGGNAALASLLTELATMGLIVDSSTA